MQKQLLLGVEAIGQGAIDGGMSGVYAYPGTPSTEITEYIQENTLAEERNIHRQWSTNEKTAYEAALGMSYAGKRAMTCMKHVGLNVAADAFMNSAVVGINGGFILAVADDPSMHSSQNEQDSRFYGKFAMIPVLEPSTQQEAYDMAYEGFQLSETTGLPVMLRITTRLAHSRSGIEQKEVLPENALILPSDPKQFVLLPALARRKYKTLLAKQVQLEKLSEESKYNMYFEGTDHSLGIIACGISYNYLMENYQGKTCPFPVLKIAQYPVPSRLIKRMEQECDEILVLEEGAPLMEEMLGDFFGKGTPVHGRLDGALPRDGELNPDLVAKALGLTTFVGSNIPEVVANRPPALCQGCGHQDVYAAMNEVLADYSKGRVFSDIGCYTLGALPPFETIYSCVDMGASVTMAKGAADAGLIPSIAVIGDSTFSHSGITGLLDAVNENSNIIVVISDNESVSMTGGQDSSAYGKIESICEGVGVDPAHIRVVVPLKKNHGEMVNIFREELAYEGVSVIIPRRECLQKAARRKRNKK
ncbi:MAG: indolepyruvate ferredoxin oxidoreductase [Bacteroidetes bacterium GWF2_42_66]|nr:MAG: indolepyruvate ferredoxin oxidoreductase [Bacteroidetes bacterium GWA2_42_15]OFX97559.1 MAG: indolepyruvate ferredoxin oxidoreductase [Bacteroidetes bacterium GWE2_42_39]OFY43746.1 MAG: indolepyruvate ferredoxin oxidoreductase [Bacteroidetes bacterium GWF2_42_66]HBL76278.1 indolepyruvate ferredoxin oxidoreductase [Prolixibacteraceae bacterium]HCU60516.1 indolepyruvate ferredoxin oxidoreductase [Prolixibacteraceae bacterium]